MSIIQPIETPYGIIYVEVTDGDVTKAVDKKSYGITLPKDAEPTGVKDFTADALQILRTNITAVATEVHNAFASGSPEEWAIEVNIGFKGKASPIPVIVSGAAEASLKVIAKWKKEA